MTFIRSASAIIITGDDGLIQTAKLPSQNYSIIPPFHAFFGWIFRIFPATVYSSVFAGCSACRPTRSYRASRLFLSMLTRSTVTGDQLTAEQNARNWSLAILTLMSPVKFMFSTWGGLVGVGLHCILLTFWNLAKLLLNKKINDENLCRCETRISWLQSKLLMIGRWPRSYIATVQTDGLRIPVLERALELAWIWWMEGRMCDTVLGTRSTPLSCDNVWYLCRFKNITLLIVPRYRSENNAL